MVQCRECGTDVQDDFRFCPYCSQAIEQDVSTVNLQDSVVIGDVNIHQPQKNDITNCSVCDSGNVILLRCVECNEGFCELCNPQCRLELIGAKFRISNFAPVKQIRHAAIKLNKFDSGRGNGTYCSDCVALKQIKIAEKSAALSYGWWFTTKISEIEGYFGMIFSPDQ